MTLPAELREIIWIYVVGGNERFEIRKILRVKGHLPEDPPLTKVSRLVREESLQVFYSHNCFESPYHMDLVWFLMKLHSGNKLGMVRNVRYRTAAASLSFLRQLKLSVDSLVKKGMRDDAFQVKIRVAGEGEVWCGLHEFEQFEETGRRKMFRRKAKT